MKKINLNTLAKEITLEEGLKRSINIGQVKEVMSLFLKKLKTASAEQLGELLIRK